MKIQQSMRKRVKKGSKESEKKIKIVSFFKMKRRDKSE